MLPSCRRTAGSGWENPVSALPENILITYLIEDEFKFTIDDTEHRENHASDWYRFSRCDRRMLSGLTYRRKCTDYKHEVPWTTQTTKTPDEIPEAIMPFVDLVPLPLCIFFACQLRRY